MHRNSSKGFTLVEMLVVITIIGILAAMAVPNFLKAKDKAKEAEAKARLKIISQALERYQTDFHQYPAYIAGGNKTSWLIFNDKAIAVDPALAQLVDPLIAKGYIDSYPANAFVDEEAGILFEQMTDFGISGQPLGDPRFGDQGLAMANVMDDPRFWDAARNPGEPELRFYNSRGAPDGTKVPYEKGGKNINNKSHPDFWPGEFFYRAIGEYDMQQSTAVQGNSNIWNFRCASYDHYIIGLYGATSTKGMDVIRLTGVGNYTRDATSNFEFDVPLALPEVMGGGSETVMPRFPYKDDANNFIFGAPDGLPDGVILAFSSGGWKATE